jgi:hypothetical protein
MKPEFVSEIKIELTKQVNKASSYKRDLSIRYPDVLRTVQTRKAVYTLLSFLKQKINTLKNRGEITLQMHNNFLDKV